MCRGVINHKTPSSACPGSVGDSGLWSVASSGTAPKVEEVDSRPLACDPARYENEVITMKHFSLQQ